MEEYYLPTPPEGVFFYDPRARESLESPDFHNHVAQPMSSLAERGVRREFAASGIFIDRPSRVIPSSEPLRSDN